MKIFQRISTLVLAIIILFSSTGLVLNKHYCGGDLKSISLLKEHAKCDMCKAMESLPACHKAMKKNHCCENEQLVVETEDYKADGKVSIITPSLLYTFELVKTPGELSLTNLFQQEYKIYRPPTVPPEDIPIKVQSFLI